MMSPSFYPCFSGDIRWFWSTINGHDSSSPNGFLYLSLTAAGSPNSWRTLEVVLIHKVGSRYDKRNYRPICLLPVVLQVMELNFLDLIIAHIIRGEIFS